MPIPNQTSLSKTQIYLGAFLAIILGCLGFWISSPSSETSEKDGTKSFTPINRREAELGGIQISNLFAKDLTYKGKNSNRNSSRTTYMASSQKKNDLLDHKISTKKNRTVTTKIINSKIVSDNLPKGIRTTNASKEAQKIQSTESELSNQIPQSSYIPTRKKALTKTTSQEESKRESETSLSPELFATSTRNNSGLPYPESNILARVGLPQAWSNNCEYLSVLYDANSNILGVSFPISNSIRICSAYAAYIQGQTIGNEGVSYFPNLGLALIPSYKSFEPYLASSPPQIGEKLATVGSMTDVRYYSEAKVTKLLSNGMFELICPITPDLWVSPLINTKGELAGSALGSIASYRGHNCFFAVDSSLLYAWKKENRNAGYRSLLDINSLVKDLLKKKLKKFPKDYVPNADLSSDLKVIPGKCMGSIRIGTERQYIEQVLNNPIESEKDLLGYELDTSDELFKYCLYPQYGLGLNYYADRLVAIETTNIDFHTPQGLGICIDYNGSKFYHELSNGSCQGYLNYGRRLIVSQGLELELNAYGIVDMMRVTI